MLNIILMLSVLVSGREVETTQIAKIEFLGNKSFGNKTLKRVITTKEKDGFLKINLNDDIEKLTIFYNEQGFWDVEIISEITSQPKGKVIRFRINEGKRIKILSIAITGNRAFSEKTLLSQINLAIGQYLVKSKIDEAEKSIILWYKNSGYPYVTVERNVSFADGTINFSITEGTLAYIKELKVRGAQKVSAQVILRTTQLKPGQKFSLRELEKARRQLYATKLFQRVSFYLQDTLKLDSITVRFDVLELPPREIGFGLGIQTPPTRLLISSDWVNYNFLSKGHNLFFSSNYTPTFSRDWMAEFKSVYSIFYIFNTPLRFSCQPTFQYEVIDTFQERELNIRTGVARYLGLKSEIGSYLQYQRIWTTPPRMNSTQSKSITNSQNFYIRYDTRDSPFTPKQGVFLSENLAIAGSILGGDNDFYKTQSEIILFHKLLPKIVFGSRLMLGLVIPYGRTDRVPYFDEFSLGGYNGLRGYLEKAIGPDTVAGKHYGEAVSNINIELRTHFEKLIDLVLFSDIGKVVQRNEIADLSPKTYQYSAGAGIRINTPLGPIRFDYAKRLKEAPSGDWGKIYFGLLNAF